MLVVAVVYFQDYSPRVGCFLLSWLWTSQKTCCNSAMNSSSRRRTFQKRKMIVFDLFRNLILVRADIAGLPFISGSLDAVHAGAAIHCWPSPSVAVAEVSRVLRPGGVFVATTYILDGHFDLIPFLKPTSQRFTQVSGSSIFLSERELEDVCRACGLVDFTCTRNGRFVMFSATNMCA